MITPHQHDATTAPDPGPGEPLDRGFSMPTPAKMRHVGGGCVVRHVSGVNLTAGPVAYGTPQVAELVGLPVGAVNMLAIRGRITPSIQPGRGSGHSVWWSPQDVVALRTYVLLDLKTADRIPPWWPAACALLQAASLAELAGRYLVCEGEAASILDLDDTAYYLSGSHGRLVTTIRLDQVLGVVFNPQVVDA